MANERVALVTGSGKKRVGAVVADELAKRGFAIAVHFNSSVTESEETAKSLRTHGVSAETYQADLADEDPVKAMVKAILTRFGRIDVLVNCAAIWKSKPLELTTAADVREHFEINTLGTFLTCQHVGLAMTKQPTGGAIVNLGDWAEIRPYLNYAAYFPSKGGVTTLTRCLAVELASRNPKVRVNAILPGPVMLPPDLPEAERLHAINATLVKQEGSPLNVAQAVCMLVENDFITGVCLPVDGGRSVYGGE